MTLSFLWPGQHPISPENWWLFELESERTWHINSCSTELKTFQTDSPTKKYENTIMYNPSYLQQVPVRLLHFALIKGAWQQSPYNHQILFQYKLWLKCLYTCFQCCIQIHMIIYLKHVWKRFAKFYVLLHILLSQYWHVKLPFCKDLTIPYIARFVVKLLQLRSSFSWLRTSSQGFVEVILKFVFLRIHPLGSLGLNSHHEQHIVPFGLTRGL